MPPDPRTPPAPTSHYTAQRDQFAALAQAAQARWDRLANLRLLLFVAAATLAGLAWWLQRPLWLAGAGLALAGFVAAVALQHRAGEARRRCAERAAMAAEGLARLRRDWAALPLPAPAGDAPPPPLAADLDLLGHASLQHLLHTPATPVGRRALEGWLLAPAPPAQIAARQAAVAELAPLAEWRDQLAIGGRLVALPEATYDRFAAWAGADPAPTQPRPLVWLARGLALATVGGFVAQALQLTSLPLGMISVALNILVTLLVGLRAERAIGQAAIGRAAIAGYAGLFEHIAAPAFGAPALRDLQGRLAAHDQRRHPAGAGQALRRLGLILALSELRASPIYLALQLTTLWNIHIVDRLDHWRRAAGPATPRWLAALGEAEAFSALATLAHDHPGWRFPTVDAALPTALRAQGLGHPLIAPARCVANDVQIGPPGSFLFITGSNMAGKSTLLRAVGLNTVLAQAGGPVCAESLALPPLALATSMRVRDSLEEGVSYFMAELRRLRAVVDAAAQARAGGPAALFLLDEILQGTNSAERQIAARRIIRRLIDLGAIGAVSSHDLALAADADLQGAAAPAHLRETILPGPDGAPQMSFDYQLRPGIAPTTNALRLLELVGLP